jgi:hypothetical protein
VVVVVVLRLLLALVGLVAAALAHPIRPQQLQELLTQVAVAVAVDTTAVTVPAEQAVAVS